MKEFWPTMHHLVRKTQGPFAWESTWVGFVVSEIIPFVVAVAVVSIFFGHIHKPC